MTAPKHYVDVGHLDEAILWIWRKGRMETASTEGGKTHEKVWGRKAMNDWRGRYEPDTGRCSITPPFSQRNKNTPHWLVEALEARFGGDTENWQFNPGRDGKRI